MSLRPSTPHSLSPALRTAAPHVVADAIARDGIAAHEDTVARLVHASRARDRAPTLAAIVLDRSAPAVVRERAFGRIEWAAPPAAAARPVDRRADAA